MPIRITCRHCGKAFSAWDDLVGKAVQCPKCQQSMVVPASNPVSPDERSGAGGASPPRSPGNRPRPRGDFNTAAPAGNNPAVPPKPALTRPVSARPTGSPPSARPRPPSKAPPGQYVTAAQFAPQQGGFDATDEPPTTQCQNCDATMPADDELCNACGYHRVLKRVIDLDGIQSSDSSAGFEHFVQRHLTDPEGAGSMLFLAKALGAVILAVVLLFCLGWYALVVIGLAAIGFAVWYFVLRKKDVADTDSPINRDPLSVAFWRGTLWLQRTLNWRTPEPPFSNLRALTLHDPGFQDEDLGDLEELHEFDVLDLEGTGITDEGVKYLKRLKKLRFVVLRRTGVTSSGVRRLQEALPEAWIWN